MTKEGIRLGNYLLALNLALASDNITNTVETASKFNLAQAQIVTLIGILLTLLVGLINIGINIHRSKVDGITQNRVEWISSVRDTTAKILQYDSQLCKTDDELNIVNAELLKNAYNLSLLLNVVGAFDATIMVYLCKFVSARRTSMNSDIKTDDYIENRRLLHLSVQIYLKCEWNRVKWENKFFKSKYNESNSLTEIFNCFSSNDTYACKIKTEYLNYLNNKQITTRPFTEFIQMQAHSFMRVDLSANADVK